MPNNPVQIVLNVKNYLGTPAPGSFGSPKDFFADKDEDFIRHRDRLTKQVKAIGSAMQKSGAASGVVKVNLRREAWAKSYRPQRALFPPEKRPCIGVSALGELYFHVTVEDVHELQGEIAAAEDTTRRKTSQKTGKEYISPSFQRSDTGAVASIEIPGAAEKRRFGIETAVEWLRDDRTSGAYFVELFGLPTTAMNRTAQKHMETVLDILKAKITAAGLAVNTFPVAVEAIKSKKTTAIFGMRLWRSREDKRFNDSANDHGRLLSILEEDLYVRRVGLPPIVVPGGAPAPFSGSASVPTIPQKVAQRSYPKIGIIDGGIGSHLQSWSIGSHSPIAASDLDTAHGSFISGLLVGGNLLNGAGVCAEADGCELYDVSVLPDGTSQAAFHSYYPQGPVDLLEEINAGVETAKRDHGVRIFNMSLNVTSPVESDSYSAVAGLLDDIADAHDVLIVVSAGNLEPIDFRPEWPSTVAAALQMLAARTSPDTILQPAESSRCLSVGSLNPPLCSGKVEQAPAAYTRRGPGLRVGVKPDVAHFGGALPGNASATGLQSWSDATSLKHGHGTSYAAPLVAKILACIEEKVDSTLSREMLTALLIHSCRVPKALSDKSLSDLMRQFSGFGLPTCSEEILRTPDHAISLIFSDVLFEKKTLDFDFVWPISLVNSHTGACRGDIRMTLVYRPVLNASFGAEFVRINLDAALKQQEPNGKYSARTHQRTMPSGSDSAYTEQELIDHGLKWWPIKAYGAHFPTGKGKSSNWRLSLKSLQRAAEPFPSDGVPFALIVEISDDKKVAPVFREMRQFLIARSVQIADIRTTTKVRV
jgi:hypothetical protein